MRTRLEFLLVVSTFIMVRGARRFNVQKRMTEMIEHYKSPDARSALGGGEPRLRDLFGLKDGEELKVMDSHQTAKGTVKVKLQETYNGMKVEGETVVEKDANGQFTGEATGKLVEGIGEDLGQDPQKITKKEAFEKALQHMHHDPQFADECSLTANLVIRLKERSSDEVTPVMVYKLSYRFRRGNRISQPTFVMDARTGKVYEQYEGLQT